MASSASIEQWSLTGGRLSSFAISVFLTLPAWSSVMPLTCSVMKDDDAMALPQPGRNGSQGQVQDPRRTSRRVRTESLEAAVER